MAPSRIADNPHQFCSPRSSQYFRNPQAVCGKLVVTMLGNPHFAQCNQLLHKVECLAHVKSSHSMHRVAIARLLMDMMHSFFPGVGASESG